MIKPLVGKVLAIHPVFEHFTVPLYRNGYALILSSTMTSALGLLYWVLAARFYTTDVVGVNSAILSAMMFLSLVAQMSMGGMLIRFVPAVGGAAGRLIGLAYVASVAAAVAVSALFLLGINIWAPSLNVLIQDPVLLVGFVVGTAMWGIFALQDSALTALRQAVWVPVENTIFGVLKILLLIGAASWLTQYGIFASWIIPVALALVPINILIFRRMVPWHADAMKDRSIPVVRQQLVRFIGGNYLGAIFFQASAMLLPILVLNRMGATVNAYFYLPWTITLSLQMMALNMSTSFTVEAARDEKELHTLAARVLVHNLRILIPIVLIVEIGAEHILGIFGAEYASQGTTMLRLLALSVIPYSFTSLYVGIQRVQNRVRHIAIVQGIRCFALLGFCYFLLPIWGITAVGMVWLAVETFIGGFLLLTQMRPLLSPRQVSAVL